MPHDTVDPAKTALLFFDMLNAYFRGSTEANQRQMEPVVANCVKIRAAADAAGIPVFYAKADHRPPVKGHGSVVVGRWTASVIWLNHRILRMDVNYHRQPKWELALCALSNNPNDPARRSF